MGILNKNLLAGAHKKFECANIPKCIFRPEGISERQNGILPCSFICWTTEKDQRVDNKDSYKATRQASQ